MRLTDIACPDPAAQSEWSSIGPPCHLFNIREGNGGDDGAKDLLLGNAHGILHVRKNSGLYKVARRQWPFGQTLPAHDGPSAFLLTKSQIPRDTFELLLRDQRPNLGIRISATSDCQRLRDLRDLPNQIVVDAPLYKEACPRTANLARVTEARHRCPWYGRGKFAISKDDVRRLATEFERHTFEIARRGADDELAGEV